MAGQGRATSAARTTYQEAYQAAEHSKSSNNPSPELVLQNLIGVAHVVVMWRCGAVACCLSFLVCGVLRAVEWCISVLWDSMAGLLTSRFVAVGVLGAADFCDAPFHSKYFKLPLHLYMEALQAMLIFYTRSCRMPKRCCYPSSKMMLVGSSCFWMLATVLLRGHVNGGVAWLLMVPLEACGKVGWALAVCIKLKLGPYVPQVLLLVAEAHFGELKLLLEFLEACNNVRFPVPNDATGPVLNVESGDQLAMLPTGADGISGPSPCLVAENALPLPHPNAGDSCSGCCVRNSPNGVVPNEPGPSSGQLTVAPISTEGISPCSVDGDALPTHHHSSDDAGGGDCNSPNGADLDSQSTLMRFPKTRSH
ncbi:hypothetical protein Nepgr_030075 [Nepenthes gracilis]|uniref:Uncharacterized protein n=1 Tax=Nepenthes gracilis TaxID=150966 RepID=A0AAD3TGJ4_NEPGR|nr:hypothetical protein Nepgr_030075 [Nepenthes gracilis]